MTSSVRHFDQTDSYQLTSSSSGLKYGVGGVAPYLFNLSLVLSSIALGISFRINPLAKFGYILVLVSAAVGASRIVQTKGLTLSRARSASLSLSVILLWTAPQLLHSNLKPVLVVGDIAQLVLLLLVHTFPELLLGVLQNARRRNFLLAGLIVAAIAGPTIAIDHGRFNPPQFLLIGYVVAAIFHTSRSKAGRAFGMAPLAAVILMIYQSGNRLVTLVAPALVVSSWAARSSARVRMLAIPGVLIIVLLLGPTIVEYTREAADSTRFSSLAEGSLDSSSEGRLDEARDVLGRVKSEWSPIEYVIGEGHGAQYRPKLARTKERSVDGLFHAVHIGPLRFFFRYGFLGLLFFAVLSWRVANRASRMLRSSDATDLAIAIAAFGILLDSLVRNPFLDPVNVCILGAVSASGRGDRP